MRAEKRLSLQLGQQVGQFAVNLYSAAVFYGKDDMVRFLLQIGKLREREMLCLAVLPEGQTGDVDLLQQNQPQQVVDLFLAHGFFQIFQHRKAVAL